MTRYIYKCPCADSDFPFYRAASQPGAARAAVSVQALPEDVGVQRRDAGGISVVTTGPIAITAQIITLPHAIRLISLRTKPRSPNTCSDAAPTATPTCRGAGKAPRKLQRARHLRLRRCHHPAAPASPVPAPASVDAAAPHPGSIPARHRHRCPANSAAQFGKVMLLEFDLQRLL